MSIQVIGKSGTIADVNGTTYRALKVTRRPVEYGLLGNYRTSLITNSFTGSGATMSVWQWRWASNTNIAVMWGVSIDGFSYQGTPSSNPFAQFLLSIARFYTANGSGGTLASFLNPSSNMTRTAMKPSQVADLRLAAAAALTAGTWTLDSQPIGQFVMAAPTTANSILARQVQLLNPDMCGYQTQSPPVFAANEGLNLVLNWTGGSSAMSFGVTADWSEVAAF